MARTLVAGVDSSTQSSTVVLRRLTDDQVVGEARAPHPSTTPLLAVVSPQQWAYQCYSDQKILRTI